MFPLRILLLMVLALSASVLARAENWRPLTPAELALTKPVVDPEAGAEALFIDVRVKDEEVTSFFRTVLTHYVRLKIFTDVGKNEFGTVQIPYRNGTTVGGIAGRTIKPDGSIVELGKDAVIDNVLVKASGIKFKVKSLAMPAVTPGAIIEYQWREYRNDQLAQYLRLPLQFEMPVQAITYHIKPLDKSFLPYHMRLLPLNCSAPSFQQEPGGFYAFHVTNLRTFRVGASHAPGRPSKAMDFALL